MEKLSSSDKELLKRCIEERAPELATVVEQLGASHLDDETREKLRSLLLDEIDAKGLKQDDEPNQLGMQLDDIVGKLSQY